MARFFPRLGYIPFAAAGNHAHCYIGKVCCLLLVRADYIRPRPRARRRGHGENNRGNCSSCFGYNKGIYANFTTYRPRRRLLTSRPGPHFQKERRRSFRSEGPKGRNWKERCFSGLNDPARRTADRHGQHGSRPGRQSPDSNQENFALEMAVVPSPNQSIVLAAAGLPPPPAIVAGTATL